VTDAANPRAGKNQRSEGVKTGIASSVIDAVVRGVSYTVRGASAPDDFFGPGQPLLPTAQEQAHGRQFDYPFAVNTQQAPRANEAVSFGQLIGLADNYDLLRLVIETRKDQIEKLGWSIAKRMKPGEPKPKTGSPQDARIAPLEAFLAFPDKEHEFGVWLRAFLEDMFVIDAATIYPRPTIGGQARRNGRNSPDDAGAVAILDDLYSLDLLDGATIVRKVDNGGRTPLPPSVAYQQVIKGLPATDYTRDDLLYLPRNFRTRRLYGYSPVEQIITTVNIALRRQTAQLQYYTEGNIPDALIGVPATWNPDEIKRFQSNWDAMLEGDTAQRRHAKFVPGDIAKNYVPTREPMIKDEYDEWLARVVCFAFSIPPTPFVKMMNRATAETAMKQAAEEGIQPLLKFIKGVMDRIIRVYMKAPDLEFVWVDDEKIDEGALATSNDVYLKNGSKSIDDIRADLGLDAIGMGNAIYTQRGPILLADFLDLSPEDRLKLVGLNSGPEIDPLTGLPKQPFGGGQPANDKSGKDGAPAGGGTFRKTRGA